MKRQTVLVSSAIIGAVIAVTILNNVPGQADDRDTDEWQRDSRIREGFAIAPVKLNLDDKDPFLVGLGSYLVNAVGGCNDCHTCPSYKPGHNPFPPPFGVNGDGQLNNAGYLAGGVDFGPPFAVVTSANLTPDSNGRPNGLTLDQFRSALRTGHDPHDGGILAVMPWPTFRFMTDRDLEAIYSYLTAIPPATPPPAGSHCTQAGQ